MPGVCQSAALQRAGVPEGSHPGHPRVSHQVGRKPCLIAAFISNAPSLPLCCQLTRVAWRDQLCEICHRVWPARLNDMWSQMALPSILVIIVTSVDPQHLGPCCFPTYLLARPDEISLEAVPFP